MTEAVVLGGLTLLLLIGGGAAAAHFASANNEKPVAIKGSFGGGSSADYNTQGRPIAPQQQQQPGTVVRP